MLVDGDALNGLIAEARRLRERALRRQLRADRAALAHQHAIRRLHTAGVSTRDIAAAVGLSHQRVHQIVSASTGKGALKRPSALATCNFCADRFEPRGGVAGPGVHICASCVERGGALVAGLPEVAGQAAPLRLRGRGDGSSCSFCGRRAAPSDPLAHAPAGLAPQHRRRGRGEPGACICRDCLTLAAEVLRAPSRPEDPNA